MQTAGAARGRGLGSQKYNQGPNKPAFTHVSVAVRAAVNKTLATLVKVLAPLQAGGKLSGMPYAGRASRAQSAPTNNLGGGA